jgi:hypothetical protein
MMWLPAVLEMAWHDGWAVVPLLREGCMPNWWITTDGPRACRDWYQWAKRQVAQLHPSVVLLGGSIGERQTPEARAAVGGILATAKALKQIAPVVIIGDPEGQTVNPIDCLLSRHASMPACTTTWPAAALTSYDRVAAGARLARVGFLPTRGFLCYERKCPVVIDHTIAYMDNNHITVAYAVRTSAAFRAAFLRAFR